MNRISFQWRITLMTAVLIAGACICLNLLLYRSGATGMDNLNGYVLQYLSLIHISEPTRP